MVLDYRFDDLNTTSRLARAVLQQGEQIIDDIPPLMSKLQNQRFKSDQGLQENEPYPPMPVSMLFLYLYVSISPSLTHGFRDQKPKRCPVIMLLT